MANATAAFGLPPLPEYTLTPRPSLVPGISDPVLQMVAPIIAYWAVSLFFHFIDTYELCEQYRLHTPVEILKRNHVTRYEVVRDVILQQAIQTAFGLALSQFDPVETIGREDYDIAVWAQRLRRGQQALPPLLALLGLDSVALAQRVASYPLLASVLAGGVYDTPSFASWELTTAKAIYWVGIPFVQFAVGVMFVDTWQYFLHRAMHVNKFLYTTLHSRHHRLYVPYAYGALYNHPFEGFLLDTLGTGLAYLLTGMTVRQGMCFFTSATIKTVDDHCGYHFPWDPLQHLTKNNAAYHDIHHQSWGIKTNFSQPFFTFWDGFLGTEWTGGDVAARYQRDRVLAQQKYDAELAAKATLAATSNLYFDKASQQAALNQKQAVAEVTPQVVGEEAREEQDAKPTVRRSTRRRTSGFDPKAISDRVAGSLHGRSPAILHHDGA